MSVTGASRIRIHVCLRVLDSCPCCHQEYEQAHPGALELLKAAKAAAKQAKSAAKLKGPKVRARSSLHLSIGGAIFAQCAIIGLQIKGPKNAYNIFSTSVRPTVIEQLKEQNKAADLNYKPGDSEEKYHPDFGDIMKETAVLWKTAGKAPFNEQAAVLKKEHEVTPLPNFKSTGSTVEPVRPLIWSTARGAHLQF